MGRVPPLPEATSLALALLLREENEDVEPSEDGVRRCERDRRCGERGRMGGGKGMGDHEGVVGDGDAEKEDALSGAVAIGGNGGDCNGGGDRAGCA
jgi:hypothetical protein